MKWFKSFLLLNIGVFLIALEIHVFMSPNAFAIGGISGLAIVLKNIFPDLTMGFFMLTMNVILLIVAFLTIGFGFGYKTIYASLALGGIMTLLEKVYPITAPLTQQPILEFFVLLVINACGAALIFQQNASTGGTDILAKLLNHYFKIDIGKGLLLVDFSIAIGSFVLIGFEKGLFALTGILISGLSIDWVIEQMEETSEWIIVSEFHEEIKDFILEDLNRGASYMKAQGAYLGHEQMILRTVIGRHQKRKLKDFIASVSPSAFVSIQKLHKTYGRGFKGLA